MTKPPLPRDKYVQIGKEKGLTFIGTSVPQSVHHKTQWKCDFCKSQHVKSYRAVRYGEHGCTCQNPTTLKQTKYEDLATRLGIQWIGESKPRNTKTATLWMGPAKVKVLASYHQLAYGLIRADLAALLGVAPDVGLKQQKAGSLS